MGFGGALMGALGGPTGLASLGGGLALSGIMGLMGNRMGKNQDPLKYANMLPGLGQKYADQLWQMQGPQMQNLAMQGARATMQGTRNAMAGTGGMRTGLGQLGLGLSRGQYFQNLMQARSAINSQGMNMAEGQMGNIMNYGEALRNRQMQMYAGALGMAGDMFAGIRGGKKE